MSNDPLLGLDSVELVEKLRPRELKWADVPPPRQKAKGFAMRTRAFGWNEEGPVVKAEPVHKETAVPAECHTAIYPPRLAPAYVVEKPSLLQRLIDFVLR